MSAVNDIQVYLGTETVDHWRDGLIDRREMFRRLFTICGSAAGVAAVLAACSSDGAGTVGDTTAAPSAASASSTTTSAPTSTVASTTTAAPSTTTTTAPSTTSTTAKPVGPPLIVAADDPAIVTKAVTFEGTAGQLLGQLSLPKSPSGKVPGVVVIHEIFGLTDHIRDVTRRLAKAGFIAVAVDLASRSGGSDKGNVGGALGQLAPADALADVAAAVAFLNAQPECSGKIGITGFCYGGGMTLRSAGNIAGLSAAVAYYGPTPTPPEQMKGATVPILAHYGASDARVNATIDSLEQNVGSTFKKTVHEGAGHGFNNDTGGGYNEAAAVAAWKETLAWFKEYLS
jgi:carboxymethylenebutenolidase